MKKHIVGFIAVLTVFMLMFSIVSFSASAETSGSLEYEVIDGKAIVTGCKGAPDFVKIPGEIEGYPVVAIGENAFKNCETLTEITIPESVVSVGEGAFFGTGYYNTNTNWTDTNSLYIGDVLVDVKYQVRGDYKVKDGTRVIADFALNMCGSIRSVSIPASVENVGKEAFSSCKSLETINVASSNKRLTSVDGVLYNKDKTTLIAYPNGKTASVFSAPATVNKIEESAFRYSKKLTKVTLPKGVIVIGDYAFSYCSGLTKFTFPESISKVPEGIFENCSSLISVVLSSSTTEIGKSAFEWCANLKKLSLPSKVKIIGESSFSQCRGLTDIYIPKSVTKIGESAFYNCKSLKSVSFGGSESAWKSIDKGFHNTSLSNAKVSFNSSTGSLGGSVNVTVPTTIGDVNLDNELNIKDATVIQKFVAKILGLDETQKSAADFDNNGKISVKDATAIQKNLAGIN